MSLWPDAGFFSDNLVAFFVRNPNEHIWYSIGKGWLYVALTGAPVVSPVEPLDDAVGAGGGATPAGGSGVGGKVTGGCAGLNKIASAILADVEPGLLHPPQESAAEDGQPGGKTSQLPAVNCSRERPSVRAPFRAAKMPPSTAVKMPAATSFGIRI
jgi:hypothetical protein